MRKSSKRELIGDGDVLTSTVPLHRLLVFLAKSGSDACMWIWRELVCWLSWMLETGPLWRSASSDALDIPAPRGPRRARRLNPHLLDALGKVAGEGDLARSGAKAAQVLRFALRRRGLWHGVGKRAGNEAQNTRAKRYRLCSGEAMDSSKVRVLSVAMDASRVGGKDTLYTAMWAPELSQGCWGDPMVRSAFRKS